MKRIMKTTKGALNFAPTTHYFCIDGLVELKIIRGLNVGNGFLWSYQDDPQIIFLYSDFVLARTILSCNK